jgi:hypothetical protein
VSSVLELIEASFWLVEGISWARRTRTGKVALLATAAGLVLWLAAGLSLFVFLVPFVVSGVLFLEWEHRTTKQRQRDARRAQASTRTL